MKQLFIIIIVYSAATLVAQKDAEYIQVNSDADQPFRPKRSFIPYPGQALQATSQVLNHPIVAAALQKISMNALATVASALNQVHLEELAKKTEVEKTLDTMASLNTEAKIMPLLRDGGNNAGSGESENESGSGAESGNGEIVQESSEVEKTVTADTEGGKNTTMIKDTVKKSKLKTKQQNNKEHRHHHRRRHHKHRHHKRHHKAFKHIRTKKIKNGTVNWSKFKNNKSLVDKFAHQANIPVTKLLAIFRSGASRSDIAKQTEELLNRTIESQAQLAQLFTSEEDLKNMKEEDEAADEDGKKDDKPATESLKNKSKVKVAVKNKTLNMDIPKGIPENCKKIVKQYADGELTLKDYLKELKICKKNEEVSAQLAKTTPMQREAVATQNLIQQEAYSYALNTMTTNFKPTAKEQANAVLDKWRVNSFGDKSNTESIKTIPDTVKSFMNIQTPAQINSQSSTDNSYGKQEAGLESSDDTKSDIPKQTTDASHKILNSFSDKNDLANLQKEEGTASLIQHFDSHTDLFKKSAIPFPQTGRSNVIVNKLNWLSGATSLPIQKTMNADEELANQPNAELIVHKKTSSIFPSGQNQVKSAIPHSQSQHFSSQLLPDQQINNFVQSKSPLAQQIQQISEPQAVAKSTITDSSHEDLSATPTIPDKSTENILENGLMGKTSASMPILTGQEFAAEEFIASLANPVLQEMPVDTSLVAALKSLSSSDNTIETNPKDTMLLASLQKRAISKRLVKRDTNNLIIAKKHNKHHILLKHRKRAASDKVKNAKPIERSNMGVPLLNAAPGPKLMDKIRDMSRVIAKP